MAESRDTPRSRGRLGWDTWREKRAHPYANAAVARTTKQAHAHGGAAAISSGPSLCEKLHASTDDGAVLFDGGRESGLCSGAHQMPRDLRPTEPRRSLDFLRRLPSFAGTLRGYLQLFAARRRDRSGGEQRRARSVDPDLTETDQTTDRDFGHIRTKRMNIAYELSIITRNIRAKLVRLDFHFRTRVVFNLRINFTRIGRKFCKQLLRDSIRFLLHLQPRLADFFGQNQQVLDERLGLAIQELDGELEMLLSSFAL